MNVLQQKLGAECYRVAHLNPRPFYCTGPCRELNCYPLCADCSGFVKRMFARATGIRVGGSTSQVARDARAAGQQRPVSAAVMGDILVHAASGHTPENSDGAAGHEGIFVAFEWINGIRYVNCWESAGSQNGVGYYRRQASFYQVACRIPALHNAPNVPIPAPEDTEMKNRLWKDKHSARIAIGDGNQGRVLSGSAEITRMKAYRSKAGAPAALDFPNEEPIVMETVDFDGMVGA